jgi:quinone-modifying oxidoreductase subunit QmoC
MPDPYVVRPDRRFLGRLLAEGGEDAKKCFQCATCSVVCDVSDGGPAFPRKEMIWTQWGLKDRLMADPDVWLCHRCNDCSTHCPRGARPGDVMAAIRREHVFHYAFPGFLARWLNQPKLLPLMLLIPIVLLGLAFLAKDSVQSALSMSTFSTTRIIYSYSVWFPQWLLIGFFLLFSGLALLAALIGVGRFWGALKAADARDGGGKPIKGLFASSGSTFRKILAHESFTKCTTEHRQFLPHLYVFYGFFALFLVSLWTMTAKYNPLIPDTFVYPFSFFSPWRMLANIGGVALLVGCGMLLWARLSEGGPDAKRKNSSSTYFDWAFLSTLLLVTLTGFASEVLHYARLEPHRHIVYFIHLVLVLTLLMYLPYSKFAHMMYRTTAMVYADYTGRTGRAGVIPAVAATPVSAEPVSEAPASEDPVGEEPAVEEPASEEPASEEPASVPGEENETH